MDENKGLTTRINLVIPLSMSIQIEKESERMRLSRAQFVKKAIEEKLKYESEENSITNPTLKDEIKEVKHLIISILEKLRKDDIKAA